MNRDAPFSLSDTEPVFADPFDARAHRKRRLVLAYQLFGALHWGDLGDGHITARDPEHTDSFWLLRYGVPFRHATVDDLVLVGPDGELRMGTGQINPAAYYIHAPIHRARPDIVSAAHTHTPYGTPWSACNEPFAMICQEAVAFHEQQALFDDGEVDIQGLEGGERVASALGEARLLILRNHGLLTVGDNVDEAVGALLMAERVAEVHCKAPRPQPISDDDARFCAVPGLAWKSFNWAIRARLSD